MAVVVGAVILWIVPIFVANSIGKSKLREGLLYGLLLGWLGVLILAVLPAVSPENSRMKPQGPQYRECPNCKERMRADASVCPHCQRDVEPTAPATVAQTFAERMVVKRLDED